MITLGQIILFTKDKGLMVSFLSDLFDLEIDNSKESIRLVNEDLSFLVIEKKVSNQNTNMMIDLFVSTEEGLHELRDKYEFINYRHQTSSGETMSVVKSTRLEIQDIGEMKFFFMTDPDNRRWKISYICR